jgi:hypothetical protein
VDLMRDLRWKWWLKRPWLAVLAGALALSLASLQQPAVTRRPMAVGVQFSIAPTIEVRSTDRGLFILSDTNWTAVVMSGQGLSSCSDVFHGGPTGAEGLSVRTRQPIQSFTVVPQR